MNQKEANEGMMAFIAAAPTPFHAVQQSAAMLQAEGFSELDEKAKWVLEPGGRYYVIRNGASIIAFVQGDAAVSEHGFAILGAHTDSPNLRVKPKPEYTKAGYHQLGVEIYGGVLLASWTDRDLGIAGRVIAENHDGVSSHLLKVDRCVARVPQLAIHLNREVNEKGLHLDRQLHMPPVIGLESGPHFIDWVAAELGLETSEQILSYELMFHVLEAPAFGGLNNEFIMAPRLDNLAMSHAAIAALLKTCGETQKKTRMVCLWDHEEVGSSSLQGAGGSFLEDVVDRIVSFDPNATQSLARAKAQSAMISADMAHAVHPNYADRHDAEHLPHINQGPVIKINSNARYATDSESSALFETLCREVQVPVQKFVMRSDLGCGSTIGPIVSTRSGIKTVDVGNPMLSMHSSREMCGTEDHEYMIRVMIQFFSS